MNIGFILLLICELLLMVFAIYLVGSWLMKTPFYPSSVKKLDKIYTEGKLKLTPNSRFIDVGSGDGRIVLWAAKKNVEVAHGIEYNPFLSLFSKLILFVNNVRGKTKIMNKDFTHHIYTDYDAVYMYIFPEYMEKLKEKLFSELPKGSMIISNTFKFHGVEPDERIEKFNIYYVK